MSINSQCTKLQQREHPRKFDLKQKVRECDYAIDWFGQYTP